jgi:hypothetical protein
MDKIVWVLGAGFSKPLGGPLLTDLLTPQSAAKLGACYPGKEWINSNAAKAVRRLYADNRYVSESSPGARLWQDAEAFLTYLDIAGNGGYAHRRMVDGLLGDLRSIGSSPYKTLASMARRLIAAECSAFLSGAKLLDSELWGPYVRWARHLTPGLNTILTFNYDRVPELLVDQAEARFHIVLPGEKPNPGRVPVLKLHGSVDWMTNGSKFWQAPNPAEHFHACDDDELVLATPGPTKVSVMRQLSALWDAAKTEVETATAIVFIGYRFPPSDSEARSRVLQGLVENKAGVLCVHVVLGPNTSNEASTRMRWLLVDAARRGDRREAPPAVQVGGVYQYRTLTFVQPPAWAEDFLDAAVEGHILQAFRFT